MEPIDLEEVRHLPIYEVLKDYCRVNRKNIQDLDTLENFYNVVKRLKECLEESDFRTAGPLIVLASVLLKIESEKLVLKHLDEDQCRKFLLERGPLYRIEVDMAVQDAYLGLLARYKDKIVVDADDQELPEIFGVDVGDLNRRRGTDEDDIRAIIEDDTEFETIRMNRILGEHLKRESVSITMMDGFDMEKIMGELRWRVKERGQVVLQEIDMDYLDAFVASLYLAAMEEIDIRQSTFSDPIVLTAR